MKRILKNAYQKMPLKKPLFDFVKLIGTPSKDITKHLYFNGFFDIKVGNNSKFKFLAHGTQIDNELYWYGIYGGWEKLSQKIWIQACQNAEVILDIGANDGLYSLAARAVNKDATIIAAEPLDFILKRFRQNIAANSMNDIEVLPIAFSNYIGEAEMFVPKGSDYIRSAAVNTNLLDRPEDKIDALKIEVDTVKDYFERNPKINKIDLVKIDVESHEPEVLEGFGDLLEKFKPTFLIEVCYERVPDLLNEIFAGMGYLYFNIDEEKGLKQQDKFTKSNSDNFLVCQPEFYEKLNLHLIK
jgi:FkbM family methyltransferase